VALSTGTGYLSSSELKGMRSKSTRTEHRFRRYIYAVVYWS